MTVIVLCVLLILCCCLLASCYAFIVYALYVISWQIRNLGERREWVSFVSLFEPGDSCIECSRIHPHRVRWWGSTVKISFLFAQKLNWVIWAMQDKCRPKLKSQRWFWAKGVKNLYGRRVHGIWRTQHLESRWEVEHRKQRKGLWRSQSYKAQER